jgi:isopentenyl-diphosphate delta-isomerase
MSNSASGVEKVVLLNEQGQAIGEVDKQNVHHAQTPLHAAFSVFLFDRSGNMLCQKRALHKKTWPGVWSNACCGHPSPGESTANAAQRRIMEELGLSGISLHIALPDFRYRATFQGIVENELCPVFIGIIEQHAIRLNPDEVASLKWVPWAAFKAACKSPETSPFAHFSVWSLMEGKQLAASGMVEQLLSESA